MYEQLQLLPAKDFIKPLDTLFNMRVPSTCQVNPTTEKQTLAEVGKQIHWYAECQLIIVSILAINAIFTIAIMTINYAMQVKPLFQISGLGAR